jgi:hypothetical protein
MDLTESQKIIVSQLAAAAGCEATLPAVLVRIGELAAGYHAGRRMLLGAIGNMPEAWRDTVMDKLIALGTKK